MTEIQNPKQLAFDLIWDLEVTMRKKAWLSPAQAHAEVMKIIHNVALIFIRYLFR